jgi:isochorismate pyruvate lyase
LLIAFARYHTARPDNISVVLTPPEKCVTLDQVRASMDAVDREMISLFATRVAYVKAAARFKHTAESVADPDRMNQVFATRRAWAEEAGLDGPVIEALYRELVSYCVAEEKRYWQSLSDVR